MSEKKNVCELCREQPVAVLCEQCCKCYCDECNEYIHKKGPMKEHKTELIPEGVRVGAMCPIHNDALRLFCVDEVKLCCAICERKELHDSHSVVDLSDINKDNETFSASEVRERFAEVLKCDDELDKKIEATIESILNEGNGAMDRIKQTFVKAHEKLEEEEAKIMGELEKVCTESEEVLQKHLNTLRKVREYSTVLNEADTKIRGECSRLMELNIVSEMEKQRVEINNLHEMMTADFKIEWDPEERKLSFAKTLFNGAPIPINVKFPDVFNKRIDISWECDESEMSEENKAKTKYVVEMKKKDEEKREWKEVYTGHCKKCNVTGLDMDSEYDVRVKCVIGRLQGEWSDVVNVRTKKLFIDSLILSQERNKDILEGKLSEWCGTTDLELLYRGTRDGFEPYDFHMMCDNKGKTVTLIKNASGHVFGGFVSIPWASPSSGIRKQAPGSFLFTLTNMYGIQPTKFSLNNVNDSAVYHDGNYGPVFGGNIPDIIIATSFNSNASSWSCFPKSFSDTTGKGNSIFSSNTGSNYFQAQEIEVFRVNV